MPRRGRFCWKPRTRPRGNSTNSRRRSKERKSSEHMFHQSGTKQRRYVDMRSTVLRFATLCVLVFTGLMAQASQLNSKTFTWSAELVALEESTRFLTVKAPV